MRNTDLDSVAFPVELKDVFVDISPNGGKVPTLRRFPGHRAVVDGRSGNPIAVVSNDYRLITHTQAIEYGRRCVGTLFEKVDPAKIKVFNVVAPATGSYCYIDMIHEGYEVNIWGQEVYLPFLRIVNSYNRSRSLKFLVGFCRKVCDNGMVFESETVSFKFPHTRESFSEEIRFDVKAGRMRELEKKFSSYMENVRGIPVAGEHAFPIFCLGMGKRFDIAAKDKNARQKAIGMLVDFRNRVSPLIGKYLRQGDANAYDLFNAMTDYASNPPDDDKQEALQVVSRQRKAGAWLQEITGLHEKSGFSWEGYLKDYMEYGTVEMN